MGHSNTRVKQGPDSNGKWVLIWDMYSVHISMATQAEVRAKYPNCFQILIPPNMTSHLQPLDLAFQQAIKHHLQTEATGYFACQVLNDSPILTGMAALKPMLGQWVHSAFAAMEARPQTHRQA